MNKIKRLIFTPALAALFIASFSTSAQADMITYDTWLTNEGGSGNYILTIDDADTGKFNITLTVDPWNAEALGLFIDFGDVNLVGDVGIANVVTSPTSGGSITLFATDTASDDCGAGCNLEGLSPPLATPDGEWELVFRLGSQGFNNIQTFSWQINDFGLTLTSWGMVGIRAQQYCSGTDTLPDGDCDGSDKSYYGDGDGDGDGDMDIPEPGTLGLLGIGLLGLGLSRRRKV